MSAEALPLDAAITLLFMAFAITLTAVRVWRTVDDLRDAIGRIEQLEAIIAAGIDVEDMQANIDRDCWEDFE